MKIIRDAAIAQINYLGKQKIDSNIEYRLLSYVLQVQNEDGILLYNNLTDELLLLNSEEFLEIQKIDIFSETIKYLVERWFLVPIIHSDVTLCNQVNSFMRFLCDTQDFNKPITNYTIFPTTDCNARCFYCYELGRKRINMSEKVAEDVADFIIKSCKGNNVTIRWFGGEPLYNSKAIDIICSKLRENDIVFRSQMISNGYLFDDDNIYKAVNLWNLLQVQITLDGTEEVYNRCKAFIYDTESPYKVVVGNIKKILDANIIVKIRMNVDEHNIDDLFKLTDILFDSFGGYKNFSMYSRLIFEDTGNNKNRTQEHKDTLLRKHNKLINYIKSKGFETKYTLDKYLRYRQCMADNPSATTILPDGNLGKCEHYSDNYFWGNIYEEKKDNDMIALFKKTRILPLKCNNCPIRPACIQLEMCADIPKECTDLIKESYIQNVSNRIRNTYIEFKTGLKQSSNLWE